MSRRNAYVTQYDLNVTSSLHILSFDNVLIASPRLIGSNSIFRTSPSFKLHSFNGKFTHPEIRQDQNLWEHNLGPVSMPASTLVLILLHSQWKSQDSPQKSSQTSTNHLLRSDLWSSLAFYLKARSSRDSSIVRNLIWPRLVWPLVPVLKLWWSLESKISFQTRTASRVWLEAKAGSFVGPRGKGNRASGLWQGW